MKQALLLFVLFFASLAIHAQVKAEHKKIWFKGIYLQWGYNRNVFTKSSLHFTNGNQYNFTLHDAVAKDRPGFDGIIKDPLEATTPQFNYRIGFYLNKKKTRAVEINFDHAKFVVKDNQFLRISGQINGEQIDKDTLVKHNFIHLEHTNGANFFHFNYVWLGHFGHWQNRAPFTWLLKGGAGFVVPKTDATLFGVRSDNKYKIGGYCISVEPCIRVYPFRHFFAELSGKTGFVSYIHASTVGSGKVSHHFGYAGGVLLLGYEIMWKHYR